MTLADFAFRLFGFAKTLGTVDMLYIAVCIFLVILCYYFMHSSLGSALAAVTVPILISTWNRLSTAYKNYQLNIDENNLTRWESVPTDRKIHAHRVYKKIHDKKNIYYWRTKNSFDKFYLAIDENDTGKSEMAVVEKVARPFSHAKSTMSDFFEMSLLSYLIGEDEKKLDEFFENRYVCTQSGWKVYHESFMQVGDSNDLVDDVAPFFTNEVLPDYVLVKGDRVVIIDMHDSNSDSEAHSKIRKYRNATTDAVSDVFVLMSGVSEVGHALFGNIKFSLKREDEGGKLCDAVFDGFSVVNFTRHMVRHYCEFYDETLYWRKCSRVNRIHRARQLP